MKPNYTEIGQRIRKQRELIGYNREELAEKLGVSTKFCSDIELGIKGMSLETLTKLTAVLKMSSDYILFGDKPESDKSSVNKLIEIFKHCPEEKVAYAEDLLRLFIKAV
jgi:transcriptional regulator with XRE-family HTH domain